MNFNGLRKSLPIILSIVGGASTIATVIFAVKDTKKAEKAIDKKKEELNKDKLTKKEIVKATWKSYIPTSLFLLASLGCNSASTIISKKRELSLIATCTMLDQGWRKYKDKIKDTLGIDTHKDIISKVMKDDVQKVDIPNIEPDKKLFHDEHIGFFIAREDKVKEAIIKCNREMAIYMSDRGYYMCDGVYKLSDFIQDAEAELLTPGMSHHDFENMGWSTDYLQEAWSCLWVDMELRNEKDDNGNDVVMISFDKDPVFYPASFDYEIIDEFEKSQVLKGGDISLDSPDYKEFIENYEDSKTISRLKDK